MSKTREDQKKIKSAKESLDDILKRIGPFMPKPPKVEKKSEPKWRPIDPNTCLPINYPKRS